MEMKKILRYLFLVAVLFTSCGKNKEEIPREYSFLAHGVVFSVGDDADEIIASLGTPNSSLSSPSCADVGSDELYIYNGFKLTVHRHDGKSVISAIELTNDTLTTREGVSIGDSAETVAKKYEDGRAFSGGVEYVGDNCTLRFFMRDGKVRSIKYVENVG